MRENHAFLGLRNGEPAHTILIKAYASCIPLQSMPLVFVCYWTSFGVGFSPKGYSNVRLWSFQGSIFVTHVMMKWARAFFAYVGSSYQQVSTSSPGIIVLFLFLFVILFYFLNLFVYCFFLWLVSCFCGSFFFILSLCFYFSTPWGQCVI